MKTGSHQSHMFKNFIQDLFLVDPENYRLLLVKFFRLLRIPNCEFALKASFGLVELLDMAKQSSESNEQLITNLIYIADKNLYKAKSLGGNTFVY